MKRVLGSILCGVVASMLIGAASASAVAPNPNPWLDRHFLNIAHQGGEDEAPSATMFALKSSIAARGADMLELDVQLTADGQLVVSHDDTVTRTTDGPQTRPSSQIRDMTLAQVQAFDAGYWFRPNSYSHNPAIPPEEFTYRGIRTGAKPPPPGYSADDFRIPTLKEVLDAFPDTPINIEIKQPKTCDGGIECDGAGLLGIPIATALAAMLDRPEYASRDDLIVVSFSDALLLVFNLADAAPKVALAPGVIGNVTYALAGIPPVPDVAAFQVPPEQYGFAPPELLLQNQDAHADGYAVHVWPTGAEPDGEESYDRLIKLGIDGYMSSQPSRLHAFLCAHAIPRPDGSNRCPAGGLGATGNPAGGALPALSASAQRRRCGKRKKLRRGRCVRRKRGRSRRK